MGIDALGAAAFSSGTAAYPTNVTGISGSTDAADVQISQQASSDQAFATALQHAYDTRDKTKLKETCKQYESIMLSMMYKQMKSGVNQGEGLFGQSSATNMFQDMMDEELMNKASDRGIGIADMMYKQLSAQMDRTYKTGSGK